MAESKETCILLAGGRGTRLHRVTAGGNKHLAAIAGKPALLHTLSPILNTPSVGNLAVVTSTESQAAVREVLAEFLPEPLPPVYAQPEPDGTLRAVLCAEPSFQHPVLAVHYGDNLYSWRRLPAAPSIFPADAAAVLYCAEAVPHDFPRYGVVEWEESDGLRWARRFVEKPRTAPGEQFLVMTGFFRFRLDALLEAAPLVERSVRGEFELPSIIPHLQAMGHRVAVEIVREKWMDYGTEESYALADAFIGARETRE